MVANFVEVNSEGIISTFKHPMIHPFNKKEHMVKDTPYAEKVRHRKNVLLMGDHLSDIEMSHGVDHETILTVGFLNSDVTRNLEAYMNTYDVVILNDGPLDFVLELLDDIAGSNKM